MIDGGAVTRLSGSVLLVILLASSAVRAEAPSTPDGTVEMPKLLHEVDPEWPAGASRRGVRRVALQVVVRTDGTIGGVTVVSSDDVRLNEAAIRAVRQRRYEPARQYGKPVQIFTMIVVTFTGDLPEKKPRPPKLIEWVEPTYPEDLLARRIDGDVELDVQVDLEGRVGDVRVVRSTDEGFSAAAILAARLWRYEPGMLRDKPVAIRVTERVEFRWKKATASRERGR